jgi:hypothetical protein
MQAYESATDGVEVAGGAGLSIVLRRIVRCARLNSANRPEHGMEQRMRYVIGICLVTGFLIWDGYSNNGHYLDLAFRQLRHVLNWIGV